MDGWEMNNTCYNHPQVISEETKSGSLIGFAWVLDDHLWPILRPVSKLALGPAPAMTHLPSPDHPTRDWLRVPPPSHTGSHPVLPSWEFIFCRHIFLSREHKGPLIDSPNGIRWQQTGNSPSK